jgi:hypothetical protein
VAKSEQLPPHQGITALNFADFILIANGDQSKADTLLGQNLPLYRQVSGKPAMVLTASALAVLGYLAALRRDYPRATGLLGQSQTLLREAGDDDLSGFDRLQHLLSVALADNFLGQVRLSQGDNGAAARLFNDGLTVARRAQDRIALLVSLYDLALSSQAQGDLVGAAGHLKEGLALAAKAGDDTSASYYLEGLAAAPGSKAIRSVPCACSPPPARSWKPKAAAGCTRSCHVSRTTTLSWTRCAPAWARRHSGKPGHGGHPSEADARKIRLE